MKSLEARLESLAQPNRSSRDLTVIADGSQEGSISVYGATSVFIPLDHDHMLSPRLPESSDFTSFQNETYLTHITAFFKWRYPDCNFFLHRESFLTDFFKEDSDIKESLPYCSEELIYAICSLGATDQRLSLDFYHRAKSLIFSKLQSFNFSNITTVQTLLCLASYDLGRGDASSAWLLSGMAFRIGQEMGFELDPQHWKSSSAAVAGIFSEYDLLLRRRIFWGCFLADRFISLILGRPFTLDISKATLEESSDLPVLKGIEDFQYSDPLEPDYDRTIDVSGIMRFEIELFDLFFKYQQGNLDAGQLHQFNLDCQLWQHRLPTAIQWSKVSLEEHGHNPVRMTIPICYYTIILTLNRTQPSSPSSAKFLIGVLEEISCLIKGFTELQHLNLAHGSLNLVYLVILALQMLDLDWGNGDFQGQVECWRPMFMKCLEHFAKYWEIADKFYTSKHN